MCDVCQRYNMPEGRPLANMGGATNGSETAYSVLYAVDSFDQINGKNLFSF